MSRFLINYFGCAGSLLQCGLFSSCGDQGLLSSCSALASHCGSFSCCGAQTLEHGLSSCGAWAQLPHGMWEFPRQGIESVSPTVAGRFFTTKPPGKPWYAKGEPNGFPLESPGVEQNLRMQTVTLYCTFLPNLMSLAISSLHQTILFDSIFLINLFFIEG